MVDRGPLSQHLPPILTPWEGGYIFQYADSEGGIIFYRYIYIIGCLSAPQGNIYKTKKNITGRKKFYSPPPPPIEKYVLPKNQSDSCLEETKTIKIHQNTILFFRGFRELFGKQCPKNKEKFKFSNG